MTSCIPKIFGGRGGGGGGEVSLRVQAYQEKYNASYEEKYCMGHDVYKGSNREWRHVDIECVKYTHMF